MAVKSESDLSDNARSLWLKAMAAMELRNYGYAISLLQGVLHEEPEFLDGRKMLRKAAESKKKKGKGLLTGFSTMRVQKMVKKDPKAAIEAIEKILEDSPHDHQANRLLRDAAMACGYTEIATFALETLRKAHSEDIKVLHELAKHYYKTDQPDRAVEIYQEIIELKPNDLEAIKAGKDAAARASMQKGGWEQAKSYRDVMKDQDEAVSLEQQSRSVLSEEMIDQQLQELHARVEKEGGTVDLARRIADLYERKENLDFAIQWYEYAAQLTGNSDATLLRKVSDLTMQNLGGKVEQVAAELEELEQGTPEYEEKRAELEQLRKERAKSSIEEARLRVQRNPTDLQLRYELGEQLLWAERFKEAIPELQKARNNPHVRIKAMNLLGQCYDQNNMHDMAVKQFTTAASEIPAMDQNKKEILYNLGLVYEKLGKGDDSLECFKQIYDADYGYRDVAKRVEESY